MIERLEGLELRLQTPVKAPRARSPLPERHMVTVIKDGERFRAWYRGKDPAYTGSARKALLWAVGRSSTSISSPADTFLEACLSTF